MGLSGNFLLNFQRGKNAKFVSTPLGLAVQIRYYRLRSKHQDQILILGHRTSDRTSWLKITVCCLLLTSLLLSGPSTLNFQFRYKAMFSLSPSFVVISEISATKRDDCLSSPTLRSSWKVCPLCLTTSHLLQLGY